jgi:hypothetical protein
MGAGWLHGRGVNLAFPVLPLHGPRAVNSLASGGFHHRRRVQHPARDDPDRLGHPPPGRLAADEGAERIGLIGLSLGGYATALVASLEDDLDCAIAGIPAAEFGELTCYHASGRALALAAEAHHAGAHRGGADAGRAAVLTPRIPRERRFIFGALADRFVPPRQVEALWRHWERPEICWYPAATWLPLPSSQVRAFVDRALAPRCCAPR